MAAVHRWALLAFALVLAVAADVVVFCRARFSRHSISVELAELSPSDMRLIIDEAGLLALRQVVQKQARTVQLQDLGKLPKDGKVLFPLGKHTGQELIESEAHEPRTLKPLRAAPDPDAPA